MKKIKLLTPIAGLVACATPLFATVSCGNNETEEEVKVFDENVKKEYDIVADNDGKQHEITIHNFQFKDDRETWGLKVEIINQSTSLTKLSIPEGKGLILSPDGKNCTVNIFADGIFDTEEITFDLKFTNARGQEFISAGFSINAKIIFWPTDVEYSQYVNVCATIDGKDYFFHSYQLCRGYYQNAGEGNTIYDIYDHQFKVSKFNGEIYVRNVEYYESPLLIGRSPLSGSIYTGFLNGLPSFNSPVHIGHDVYLTNQFLCHDSKFNSPVTFESNVEVEFIDYDEIDAGGWSPYFMSYNKVFNQSLDLSNVYFTMSWLYAQRGIDPHMNILYNCYDMTSEVTFRDCITQRELDILHLAKCLSVDEHSSPSYKQGIKIKTINSDYFRKTAPDFNGEEFYDLDEYENIVLYRKLVVTEIGK